MTHRAPRPEPTAHAKRECPLLRILHTSDWHLGHTFHDIPRDAEHADFLDQLLNILSDERPDALLVTGDVFDTANPPASAVRAWFDFLAAARAAHPRLDIVVIGGNHDSARRLEAPGAILGPLGIRVVGSLPRGPDGPRLDELLVPLRDRDGRAAALCVAMPYLRPADLPAVPEADDPLIEGVRRLYAEATAVAREAAGPGRVLVATGHCYVAGTALSELSERRILGGNQHALPADVFPDDLAAVFLGHLHRPQHVGGDPRIHYAGSPIPLSVTEASYPHQVHVVDLDDEGHIVDARPRRLRRLVDVIRIPARGSAPLDAVLAAIAELPPRAEASGGPPPYLDVEVLLDRPDPTLRATVEQAVASRAARLVRLGVAYAGDGDPLAARAGAVTLADLTPEEVFRLCHRRQYDTDPAPELLQTFRELLAEVQHEAQP